MMYREGIQFPPKDLALREDVHALGSLIGEVLRGQGGEEYFALVEGDRRARISRRAGGAPEEGRRSSPTGKQHAAPPSRGARAPRRGTAISRDGPRVGSPRPPPI